MNPSLSPQGTEPVDPAAAAAGTDDVAALEARAAALAKSPPARDVVGALKRGALCRCPACGTGAMFPRYLKVADACGTCGEELHHHRADDAPPYAVIMVAGHIIVPLLVLVEELYRPEVWVHLSIFLPLTLVLCLALLPPLKGMLVGLQWALRMHGFDPASPEREPLPASATLAPAGVPAQ